MPPKTFILHYIIVFSGTISSHSASFCFHIVKCLPKWDSLKKHNYAHLHSRKFVEFKY